MKRANLRPGPDGSSWLTVRLPSSLLNQLRHLAITEDRPVSALARRILADAVKPTSEDCAGSIRRGPAA